MRIDSSGTVWKVNYFKNCHVGSLFWCNGNKWRKQSTKTARMVNYGNPWFYFRQNDVIETQLNKEST